MQIVEHSIIGTRSAMLRLKSRHSEIRFLLFPMIHVAEPGFYRDVTTRRRECDLLVVEGIHGRSALVSALTATYRVIPANRWLGLVEQDIDYRSLGVPIISPDASASEVGTSWRRVPLAMRLAIWCLIPLAIAAQLVGARRRLLSPDMEVNDLPIPRACGCRDGGRRGCRDAWRGAGPGLRWRVFSRRPSMLLRRRICGSWRPRM